MSHILRKTLCLGIASTLAVISAGWPDPALLAQGIGGFGAASQIGLTEWASFDAALGAPACSKNFGSCDSGGLLYGRANIAGGPEQNQPNTLLNSACPDGTQGTFHADESIDRIRVYSTDGGLFMPGKVVTVDVAVWGFSPVSDFLDVYYTSEIGSPSPTWTLISSTSLGAIGPVVKSVNYTLPAGGNRQAVRAHLRFGEVATPCTIGPGYSESDDLVFRVRQPLIDLNGDDKADAFIYKPSTGSWGRELSQFGGGFQGVNGAWATGWVVQPGRFDNDTLTDFFVFSPTTGQWFKMLNNGTGFVAQSVGYWWTGWQRHLVDLDGDGITDVFLFDPITGQWFKCISTPTGFTYLFGGWSPGWEIHPLNLNDDAKQDFFLFRRTTGEWAWAVNGGGATFTYPVWGSWATDWQLYPGDFDGNGKGDLLLHRPSTGQYFVATTTPSGFSYLMGGWTLGWTPYVVDLDADNVADLFLYDQGVGNWVELLSDGNGQFATVGTGRINPFWGVYPTDLNADGRTDLFLYNSATGQFFQAWNLFLGSFAYFGGGWDVGFTVFTGPIGR